uniref:Glycylpeptide N-tetradecanoyltransferase n=1 Tax=Oryzias latipes TaxID=8090 RepID=A0A3B3HZ16_ORYLA
MSFTDEEGNESLKKSKKKLKGESAWRPEGPRDPFALLDSLPEKKQQEIQRALHLFSLGRSLPKTLQEAKKHTYRFWGTQPVPKLGEKNVTVLSHGPIEGIEASVRDEPYTLPQGFSWDTLDLSNPFVVRYFLETPHISSNYPGKKKHLKVCENVFLYHCTPCQSQWHCGVRVQANKKLVGFIAAVPADVQNVSDREKQTVHVKLLCVHKKLRQKRMAPVLVRELTRRVNLQGLYQAVYTADIVLPTPLSSSRLWHRPLNPRKLMEVNYPRLRQNMNLQRALKFNRLPETTKTNGLRPMTKKDAPEILSLLQDHLCKFKLSSILSLQQVEHWLLPRQNVIDTYVVEGDDGSLTDVVSFYSVTSRVLNHPVHTALKAAHLLCMASTGSELTDLMGDALILAKSNGFDIFTAFDVMDNAIFLEKLKFTVSDKSLHYYLYNWMCPWMNTGFLLAVK